VPTPECGLKIYADVLRGEVLHRNERRILTMIICGRALMVLEENERRVLILRAAGFNYREIAFVMKRGTRSVMRLIELARAHMILFLDENLL
jgi:DNA-directed RNA polymerase specialized sigma24 family protein